MKERLIPLLDTPRPSKSSETSKVSLAGRVAIKTFHAFGALLVREHAARLGLSPDFAILTDEDRLALLKQACPELKQAEVDDALAQISAAKAVPGDGPRFQSGLDMPNPLKRIDEGADQPAEAGLAAQAAVSIAAPASIYERYEAALRQNNAVDFDDLIVLPIRLLEDHPDVLTAVQMRPVDRSRRVPGRECRPVSPVATVDLRRREPLRHRRPRPGDQRLPRADRRYFLQFEQDYPGAVTLAGSATTIAPDRRHYDAATQVIAVECRPPGACATVDFSDEVKLDVYRCRPPTKPRRSTSSTRSSRWWAAPATSRWIRAALPARRRPQRAPSPISQCSTG